MWPHPSSGMQPLRVYDGKMLVQPDSLLHASDFCTGETSRGLLRVRGQPQGQLGFQGQSRLLEDPDLGKQEVQAA